MKISLREFITLFLVAQSNTKNIASLSHSVATFVTTSAFIWNFATGEFLTLFLINNLNSFISFDPTNTNNLNVSVHNHVEVCPI